jgi:hypothetical protein
LIDDQDSSISNKLNGSQISQLYCFLEYEISTFGSKTSKVAATDQTAVDFHALPVTQMIIGFVFFTK